MSHLFNAALAELALHLSSFEYLGNANTLSGEDLILLADQSAASANLNSIFAGNIDFLGDKDMFNFSLEANTTYRFDIRGSHSNHGTLWDPQAFLYDDNNTLVAQDDDSGTGFDSSIAYTATETGDYYLSVMGNIGELLVYLHSKSIPSYQFGMLHRMLQIKRKHLYLLQPLHLPFGKFLEL